MCLSWLRFHPCAGSEPDCNCCLSNKYTYMQLRSPEVTRVNFHLTGMILMFKYLDTGMILMFKSLDTGMILMFKSLDTGMILMFKPLDTGMILMFKSLDTGMILMF